MAAIFGFDCYSPAEIAERVENVGVKKAHLPLLSMAALGVLAGGFVGLGSMGFTVVASDKSLGFGITRVIGGLVFSLGLVLVVVAGAELFTGNNLLVMAWVSRRISTAKLVRDFVVVFFTNLIGAIGLALLASWSGYWRIENNAVAKAAMQIAAMKCGLSFSEAFFRGVLCNVFVCLAVWTAMAGRNVADKVLAVIFPITGFVLCGFEHSVANMYFIPFGILLQPKMMADSNLVPVPTWSGFIHNLVPVTLGNIAGGAAMVGLVYWIIYRRDSRDLAPQPKGGEHE